jgi:hypothetical protein
VPIETLRCRKVRGFGRRADQARERRLGEIPAKAFVGKPWKGETQGRLRRLAI